MSLILPGGPCFTSLSESHPATPASTPGVNVTAGANNADGSSVALITAMAHEARYLVIGIGGYSASTIHTDTLLDILIDPAGGSSWNTAPLISDLVCGATQLTTNAGTTMNYHFPLLVPAGASLGARARTVHTSDITTGYVVLQAFGNPRRPDLWWYGSRVESLGIAEASSKGTDVAHTNGSYGSWVDIGASTMRYGAIQFGTNSNGAVVTTTSYYFQLGAGGQRLAGTPTMNRLTVAQEYGPYAGIGMPIWCDVPSGTTLQCRAMSNAAGNTHNVGIYGVAI